MKKRMIKKSSPVRRSGRRDKGTVRPTKAAVASPFIPIVGIGASAGGLEALEQFLKNVPAES
ncbi:MAG TPA: hypothetical protein VLD18_05625, partial [Verrucomicrobiae bacterium]|nr:hypothetical protein [Verrucomicrobiae bacterium]